MKRDLKIMAKEVVPGGDYDKVVILGKGHITGDLNCNSFASAGAGQVDGALTCEKKLECSGSLGVEGTLTCGELEVNGSFRGSGAVRCEALELSGSAKLADDLTCRGDAEINGKLELAGDFTGADLECSGSMHLSGSAKCADVEIAGKCRVEKDFEADAIRVDGTIQVPGLLNAERIQLYASPNSVLGEIGGSEISIGRDSARRHFHFGEGENLQVRVIEGDTVTLAYTTADVVRGRDVTIGKGCRIGRVEYTERFEAAEETVQESCRTAE